MPHRLFHLVKPFLPSSRAGWLSVAGLALTVVGGAQSPAGSAAEGSGQAAAPAVQTAPGVQSAPVAQTVAGGRLHGSIKAGNTPLPGVTVTATNTLTGKHYATTTDITGAWSMTIPQNGRYVIRTQFAAFAAVTHEALLNATTHEQAVDFQLQLASRAAAQEARQDAASEQGAQQVTQAIRQLAGNGAQTLSLINSLSDGTDAAEGGAASAGAALPGAAQNSAFSSDSVAVSGQSGTVSPLAGTDVDRIRDAMATMQAQGMIPGGGGFFGGGGGPGGGGFGGGAGGFGGGPGGLGGFGGGRGNFRSFRPDQPHGAIYWNGNNSALNAQPYSLRGQPSEQPTYGSNQFGVTLMGEPFIPHLVKPSGKDTVFLNLSGTRSSTPSDVYAIVPTQAERGNCSGVISATQSAGCNLLTFFPLPNLSSDDGTYNYYFASTAQQNSTQGGLRYMRAIGPNASLPTGGGRGGRGGGGGGGGARGGRNNRNGDQPLRQSVNANFNFSDSAADIVNLFPDLGGKSASHSYSLQAGYSLGVHRINNNLTGGWNRTVSQTTNFFTNKTDIATLIGVLGPGGGPLNSDPLNYGVPDLTLAGSTGLSETQPSFGLQQTISASDTLSLRAGKHNYRFGGDYRRVHYDFLGSSNATGTFIFASDSQTEGAEESFAKLLAGTPDSSTIISSIFKSYLRQNSFDLYALDDFRAFSSLTLNYGVRYEYFSPYGEKYNHLGELGVNPGYTNVSGVYPGCVGGYCDTLPDNYVEPFHAGISPRLGLALRLPKQTVVRSSYAISYTNGQYLTIAKTLVRQPPYSNLQTNTAGGLTLRNGFPVAEPDQAPNYSIEPHYHMPYVQLWNLDIQKTLPWGLVLSVGYNGSKGTHLDVTSAPDPNGQVNPYGLPYVPFKYEQSSAFSKMSAGTVRLNKRMSHGISVQAFYQYSHSIDDAGSVGGSSTVVAQNWQDLNAEEANSSFDVRHKVTGTYVFELPFGKDKFWLTSGAASHILEGLSVSGAFAFATGGPLTPSFQASTAELATNTEGTERPNRIPGTSITTGGGSVLRWFNTGAYDTENAPANGIGNAPRNSIPGPGTITNSMSVSKTAQLGDTRSLEVRANFNNVFNTVQYSSVDTSVTSATFGQVQSAGPMRQLSFLARFRF